MTEPPEELRGLLAAVQDWAQRTMPAPSSGHAGPECEWCPLCQLAAVLRGEGPEFVERLGEAGTAVVAALRALLDNVGTPRPATSRVQHIRLDDEAEDVPGDSPRVQRIHLVDPREGSE